MPIAGPGVHREQKATREAIAHLTVLLERNPAHPTARWLLNIASMAAGDYPDKVPGEFLIPPHKFASEEDFPRFLDVAQELGVSGPADMCGGTIIDDFDGDGYLDIVCSSWDTLHAGMHYFRNNADGTFVDRTAEAGLANVIGGLNLVQGDYDNDGDLDIFILRGAWLADKGKHPNSLLANDGRGFFRDVTFDVGLEEASGPSHSAAFADYDLDGDLDLYVGSESGYASQLWENDGRGRFTNVASRAGVLNRRFAKGVAWGDIDGDRFPDLFVSNYKGENRMYRNNRNGTFTDVAEQAGVTYPLVSFATWFWDYNNDGALDLYVASYIARMDDLAGQYLGHEYHGECQCLYEGDGHGGFRDVTAERKLLRVTTTMGANFGDLDNDGYPDFYLGTGYPDYEALMPNVMYHNQKGRGFADVSTAGGFGHLQKGHGVGFGDLDNDGDQDVYIQLGGAFPGDVYGNSLFENPGFGGHWIGVRLVGQRSNRFGVGARIHVVIHEEGLQRDVYQFVTTGGSFGCNPLRQQLGLGRAMQIDRLDIFWPATGETQSFQNVGADQFLEITEGKSVYRRLDLKRLEFRRSAPKDADVRSSMGRIRRAEGIVTGIRYQRPYVRSARQAGPASCDTRRPAAGPGERPDHRGVVAADRELESREIPETVEGVPAIGLLGTVPIPVAHLRRKVTDPATDHDEIVVAKIIGVQQRDPQRPRLVLEQLQGQRIPFGGQSAEPLRAFAQRSGLAVQRVFAPRVERQPVTELMCERGERDGRLGGAVRVADQQLPVVRMTKRVRRESEVADMAGASLAAAHDLPLPDRSPSEPRPDDDHEQRREA
jgi:hypothetical protein